MFGSVPRLGFSFEWHDFTCAQDLDWARSYHPGSVEVCLNLEGRARVEARGRRVELGPMSTVFYYQGEPSLRGFRRGGERHRFVTVELSAEFLADHLRDEGAHLHPLVGTVVARRSHASDVGTAEPMDPALSRLIEGLRQAPVFEPAQRIWFRCQALALVARLFFRPAEGELFCSRAQRVAQERVERVQTILREDLEHPPSLEELGRRVGCSPFHLSRLFSRATGMTLQQYLRQARLEKAAELLRSGRCNVTEAAFAVGYNSLSHFSLAFREAYGCCLGLYPIRTSTQREGGGKRRPAV